MELTTAREQLEAAEAYVAELRAQLVTAEAALAEAQANVDAAESIQIVTTTVAPIEGIQAHADAVDAAAKSSARARTYFSQDNTVRKLEQRIRAVRRAIHEMPSDLVTATVCHESHKKFDVAVTDVHHRAEYDVKDVRGQLRTAVAEMVAYLRSEQARIDAQAIAEENARRRARNA